MVNLERPHVRVYPAGAGGDTLGWFFCHIGSSSQCGRRPAPSRSQMYFRPSTSFAMLPTDADEQNVPPLTADAVVVLLTTLRGVVLAGMGECDGGAVCSATWLLAVMAVPVLLLAGLDEPVPPQAASTSADATAGGIHLVFTSSCLS